MSGFALHPEAFADLDDIWEYIAADNVNAADRSEEAIYQAISSLTLFPYRAHTRPDLTSRPLRFHPVREYLIVYAPEEKPLVVIAILHGRRNPLVIAAILRGRA
jgi:toxin ParE1/3/4